MKTRGRWMLLAALAVAPALACAAPQDEGDDAVDQGEDELRSLAAQPAGRAQLPRGYDALSAVDKQNMLAQLIAHGEYCSASDSQPTCLAKLPTGGFSYYLRAIPAILSLSPTFNYASDEAPEGRRKIFHPFGVAGTAEFTADYKDEPTDRGHAALRVVARAARRR